MIHIGIILHIISPFPPSHNTMPATPELIEFFKTLAKMYRPHPDVQILLDMLQALLASKPTEVQEHALEILDNGDSIPSGPAGEKMLDIWMMRLQNEDIL